MLLVITSCYKGSSGSLIKRKYNKGFFVQHSGKVESRKIQVTETQGKKFEETESVRIEKESFPISVKQAETSAPLSSRNGHIPTTAKSNPSAFSNSTSAQINKIKVAAQKKSQRQHPNGCFNDPGFNDVTGPLAIVVFFLLTILYAAAIMAQSPGANWIVALALGALFAAITMVTGVSCM